MHFSESRLFAHSFEPGVSSIYVLPLRIRVDLIAKAMEYTTFPKSQDWRLIIRLLRVISRTLIGGVLHISSRCILQYSPSRPGWKDDIIQNLKIIIHNRVY